MKIKLSQIIEQQGHRNGIEPDHVKNLSADIGSRGFDPECAVILRKIGRGKYEVIDGHHRIEALRALGVKEVEADVRDVTPLEADRIRYSMNHLRRKKGATHYLSSYASRFENMKGDGLLEGLSDLQAQRAVAESLSEQGSNDAWFKSDGKVSQNTTFCTKALKHGLNAKTHFIGRDVHGIDGGLVVVNGLDSRTRDINDALETGDIDTEEHKDLTKRVTASVKKQLAKKAVVPVHEHQDDPGVFTEADEILAEELPVAESVTNEKPIEPFVARWSKMLDEQLDKNDTKAREFYDNVLPFAEKSKETQAIRHAMAVELEAFANRLNEMADLVRQNKTKGLRAIK